MTDARAMPAPLVIGAATSAAAGLIHAAAAGSHNGTSTLAVLFALTAIAELGAAAAALVATTRFAALALASVNGGAVLAWAFTRASGVDFVPGLTEAQAPGLADTTAAALASLAVLSASWAASRRDATSAVATFGPFTAGVAGAVALLAAIPAMATPHAHADHDDHAGGSTELAAASGAGSHAHAGDAHSTDPVVPPAPTSEIVAGVTLPIVEGVTAAQKAAAADLIARTRSALAAFPDVAAAEAAGFRSIGDGRTGYEHFVHAAYLANDNALDPTQPESLVFEVSNDGTRTLASAMYILPPGKTMDDVPDVAGPLAVWHDHQNLCWDPTGTRLAGVLVDGTCRPGGTFRPTPPMLHVWLTEHPCGPFAGIEGSAHSGACHSAEGH